jgi:hypothetical protein
LNPNIGLEIKTTHSDNEQQEQAALHLQKSRSAMVEPLLYLCFALVAFLLYSNTFQNPYIFDD